MLKTKFLINGCSWPNLAIEKNPYPYKDSNLWFFYIRIHVSIKLNSYQAKILGFYKNNRILNSN